MVALFSDVIKSRRAKTASGAATEEKTDLLQVRPRVDDGFLDAEGKRRCGMG